MTEYDFSPEAYDRYIQTQHRVADWVSHTEQHRQGFESAAPGAPGIPPVLRRPSPPIPERYIPSHRPSPSYPMAPIYHRAPPSSSSSEGSYVHVQAPHIHRLRPPPPPIYAPPVPPLAPFPVQSRPSPVLMRGDGDRHSPSSSRRRHHRSQSHSYPHRSPPPLVTPIYTSPSPFIPPPPIIYMSSPGYPAMNSARPVVSPRELYRKPSSPRKARRPPTPPATPLSTTSDSSDDTPTSPYHTSSPQSPTSAPFPPSPAPASGPSNSGPGGSRPKAFSGPWQEDQNQKHGQYRTQHHRHASLNIIPGLNPPYISRNLQEQSSNSSQRPDYQHRSYSHPYRDQSRSTEMSPLSHSHPHSQSRASPAALRPQQYARYSDPSYDRAGSKSSTATSTTTLPRNGVISISVPRRYPVDDRDLELPLSENPNSSRSYAHNKQIIPPVLHAPQPIRHPDMLSPQLRASARA
ncbi:hypothetical protein NP233_g2288 [Leucocoprinus birnbaumii]|uniref:Uncharacterized protein n=1 Tax=Leucocoprinus birnbaumii TaxID=56174 RepID=A0AAD5YYY0_9AGAR|nr:hypothetical protein NP233_g2288 [Leucocoprinus birnbaumii]